MATYFSDPEEPKNGTTGAVGYSTEDMRGGEIELGGGILTQT